MGWEELRGPCHGGDRGSPPDTESGGPAPFDEPLFGRRGLGRGILVAGMPMTFDEVRPVVERLLYAYGLFRRQATASQGTPNALRHEDAGRLEAVLGQLAHFERQLVAWRYFERLRWDELARRTKMPSTVLCSNGPCTPSPPCCGCFGTRPNPPLRPAGADPKAARRQALARRDVCEAYPGRERGPTGRFCAPVGLAPGVVACFHYTQRRRFCRGALVLSRPGVASSRLASSARSSCTVARRWGK